MQENRHFTCMPNVSCKILLVLLLHARKRTFYMHKVQDTRKILARIVLHLARPCLHVICKTILAGFFKADGYMLWTFCSWDNASTVVHIYSIIFIMLDRQSISNNWTFVMARVTVLGLIFSSLISPVLYFGVVLMIQRRPHISSQKTRIKYVCIHPAMHLQN